MWSLYDCSHNLVFLVPIIPYGLSSGLQAIADDAWLFKHTGYNDHCSTRSQMFLFEWNICSIQISKAAQLDSKVHGVCAGSQMTGLPSLTQFWKMFIASGEYVKVSTPGQLSCSSCLIFPCPVTSQVIVLSFPLFCMDPSCIAISSEL